MSLKRSDKSANGNSAPATDAAGDIPKYRSNARLSEAADSKPVRAATRPLAPLFVARG